VTARRAAGSAGGQQGAADHEHLPLAAGEVVRRLIAALGQPREQLVDPVELLLRRLASEQRSNPQVLVDGQLGDHAAPLGHM